MIRMKALLLLLLSILPPAVHAQEEKAKPNVLWIYLEDVSGWFSC